MCECVCGGGYSLLLKPYCTRNLTNNCLPNEYLFAFPMTAIFNNFDQWPVKFVDEFFVKCWKI